MNKKISRIIMALGIMLICFGVFLQVPSKDLTTYSFLENEGYSVIEEYVGGDAYNYIIGAALVGGEIAGVKTQKAVYIAVGTLIFCLGLAVEAYRQTNELSQVIQENANAQQPSSSDVMSKNQTGQTESTNTEIFRNYDIVGTAGRSERGVDKSNTKTPHNPAVKRAVKKTMCVLFVVVLVIGLVVMFVRGKNELHTNLLEDWWRMEIINGNIHNLKLQFEEGEIKYTSLGSDSDELNLGTFEYKVISPKKIKILNTNQIISVEINDDHMFLSPGLTSDSESETWHLN